MADIDIRTGTVSIAANATTAVVTPAIDTLVGSSTVLIVGGAGGVVVVSGSGSTLTLRNPWPFGTVTNVPYIAFNSLNGLADLMRRLEGVLGENLTLAESFEELLKSTSATIPIVIDGETINVRPWGNVLQESQAELDQFLLDNQNAITRQEAEKKLKRDAVVYLDFANNEGKEADDFTVIRDDATNLITYTAADGVSVQTADGRVVFAPANTAALSWNNGRAVGLVGAPASTNLAFPSEGFTVGSNSVKTDDAVQVGDLSLSEYVESTDTGNRNFNTLTNLSGRHSIQCVFKPLSVGDARFLILSNVTQGVGAFINCSTLEVSSNAESYSVEPLTNGCYRFTVTIDGIINGDAITGRMRPSGALSAGFYTGDGVSGLYLGGFQTEQGYPTPYIKTEASQVTRGEVSSSIPIADKIKDKFCLFIECIPTLNATRYNNVVGFNKNTLPRTRGIGLQVRTTNIRGAFRTDTVSSYSSISGVYKSGDILKAMLTYDGGIATVTANGQTSEFQVSGDVSDFFESIYIGGSLSMGGLDSSGALKVRKIVVSAKIPSMSDRIALTTLEAE